MEQQDKKASAWDIFKSVIATLLVSKSYISLSRVLFYKNLLKGSEDLSWYVGHWGGERALIFVRVPLSLPWFFFLRIFAPLMAQNCDFTDPDAQGQRKANK